MEAAKLREIIRTIFAKVRFHGKKVSLSRAGNRELFFYSLTCGSRMGMYPSSFPPFLPRFTPGAAGGKR